VFVIEVLTDEGRLLGGASGVAVADDQVITNEHVTARGTLRVRRGGSSWTVSRVVAEKKFDLALLTVDRLNAVPADWGTPTAVGDRVYAIGAPRGLELTMSDGLISAIRPGLIQTTAPISPGSSGGGLFDQHGRLIGITTSSLREGQNLNFAVPIDHAMPLLAAELHRMATSLSEPRTPEVHAAASESMPIVRSLPTGTDLIEPTEPRGRCVLSVNNGTDRDATVKLTQHGQLHRWVYVKARSTATVDGVRAGTYHLLFSLGRDWNSESFRFQFDQSFTKFEDEFDFVEKRLADGVEYSRISITLHGVPHGNAPSEPIDQTAFEAVSRF
jgi:hypothetical protein